MTVEKPKPKQLLRPITTGADSAMNQSQFLAINCASLEAREKSRVRGAIGFGFDFDSQWLKNWRESFKPIAKRSNWNLVITFDSQLKTALSNLIYIVRMKGLNACCCAAFQPPKALHPRHNNFQSFPSPMKHRKP